ncbi:hypothetical protein ASC94_20700 [Massilia sp. Root418]|uniref:GtrA family protein n=1 Tax=Massilia sp. Root418 TaxID=1736532 RepID=UPI0006FB1DB0|nr:GtrA family protein [Massilia sp. Root418]KQW90157.1 hypothetical protein ASC94_20700 [Massilia sp. Root418]
MMPRLPGSLLRFLLVGMANTMVGMGTIFICQRLGVHDVAANATGYGLGLLFSFFCNRAWTFRHTGPVWPAAWRFGAVFAVAYTANLATTLAALQLLGAGSFLAQLAGMPPYTALFYLGSRFLVFKRPAPASSPYPS